MSDIDFYSDFTASSGKVLGLGVGSTPDEWSQKLGNEFDENQFSEGSISRDFGFIGLDFLRVDNVFSCHLLILAIHKLDMNLEHWDAVPEALHSAYGKFSSRVPLDALIDPLENRGLTLLRIRRGITIDLDRIWIPETRVEISVVHDPEFARERSKQVGDIYSIAHLATSEVEPDRLEAF
ncbi:hypothetical protein [Crossiella sp. NPDC003009]